MIDRGFTEVDVVGIDGGSPDHIFGTLATLTEAPVGLSIHLHHSGGITKRLHPDDGTLDFIIPNGDEFSVFALESCQQVSITGARWNLNSEALNFLSSSKNSKTHYTYFGRSKLKVIQNEIGDMI